MSRYQEYPFEVDLEEDSGYVRLTLGQKCATGDVYKRPSERHGCDEQVWTGGEDQQEGLPE